MMKRKRYGRKRSGKTAEAIFGRDFNAVLSGY
jgi:hypothetical protein